MTWLKLAGAAKWKTQDEIGGCPLACRTQKKPGERRSQNTECRTQNKCRKDAGHAGRMQDMPFLQAKRSCKRSDPAAFSHSVLRSELFGLPD